MNPKDQIPSAEEVLEKHLTNSVIKDLIDSDLYELIVEAMEYYASLKTKIKDEEIERLKSKNSGLQNQLIAARQTLEIETKWMNGMIEDLKRENADADQTIGEYDDHTSESYQLYLEQKQSNKELLEALTYCLPLAKCGWAHNYPNEDYMESSAFPKAIAALEKHSPKPQEK